MTGSLFSEQLWWILLKQHFPCSKLPPLLGVTALCLWLAFKRESPYMAFFFFIFIFLVDPDYKHYFRMMWFSSINS